MKWFKAEGFKSLDEAKEYHHELWGKEWETYPLTVIKWGMKGKSLSELSHGEAQD